MIIRFYSLFDTKALIYNTPFPAPTNGAAVRMLSDIANDLSTAVGRHPADYVLYCVGTYNDQDGAMVSFQPMEHVVDAVALLRIQPQTEMFGRSVPTDMVKPLLKEPV